MEVLGVYFLISTTTILILSESRVLFGLPLFAHESGHHGDDKKGRVLFGLPLFAQESGHGDDQKLITKTETIIR